MDLKKRINIDFGRGHDSLSYQPSFKKTGYIDYSIFCVINIESYFQFNAIATDNLDEKYKLLPRVIMGFENTKDPRTKSIKLLSDLKEDFLNIPHTRNIYLYCNNISVDPNEVIAYFLKHNFRLFIRSKDYFDKMKADFFISHDSRDKDEIARPLYEELSKRGYKVWYDEYSLNIGDSLTESIEKGIASCRYGIVVLSGNFLSNEKWAKNELQSLKTKQIVKNDKSLLPVWHNIGPKDLEENFWILDKVGGNTNQGIEKLADQIERAYKTA